MLVWHWIRFRIGLSWWVLRHDSTAFAEAISGAALIALRGALLLGFKPSVPFDVIYLLGSTGITEERFAVYLMLCGVAQLLLAGSRHSLLRLWLKIAILAAFILLIVAYTLTENQNWPVVIGLLCVAAFYFVLMLRIFLDRRRGVLSLEERRAHVV